VFTYTIQAGDNDTDGISIGANALALDSGSISDGANNATLTHSAVSANSSYLVDATAPTATWSAATDNVGTVTGALTSGDTTNDTALVLSGTNESGASVMVYNSTTELGAATVSGTGWSYSATVADGTTYQFNVKGTDLAGNTSSATSNFAVTGDTTAPTLAITMTNTGGQDPYDIKSGDNNPTIRFNFSEAPSGFAAADISVQNGNKGTFTEVNGTRYSLIFEYSCDDAYPTNVVTVGQDWNDAAGNAPANNSTSPNYKIDASDCQ
jgi:hypothetical protein